MCIVALLRWRFVVQDCLGEQLTNKHNGECQQKRQRGKPDCLDHCCALSNKWDVMKSPQQNNSPNGTNKQNVFHVTPTIGNHAPMI